MLTLTMTDTSAAVDAGALSGIIQRLGTPGLCYIASADGALYACRLSKVRGFRGPDPEEFGLIKGAPVRFSLRDANTVEFVELLHPN